MWNGRGRLSARGTGTPARQGWMRRAGIVLPYLVLTVVSLPIVLGYTWLLISSFSQRTHGLKPVGGFTLEHWRFLIEPQGLRPSIWSVTLNTFLLALGLTVVVVAVSSLAGYALSRLRFPGRRLALGSVLVLHAFPVVTLLIGTLFVLRALHLYNTLVGVLLVMVAFQLPLGIWLMKGFFDEVPWDVERAALIDGSSRWRVWWEIVLPQVRPGIAALAIFAFLSGWGEFLIPYTFTLEERQGTIAVYLQRLLGGTTFVDYGEVAAVGLFQMIPVILFFLFTQEYLLRIFSGGTKGGA